MAVQIPPFPVRLWNEEDGWREESVSPEGLLIESPGVIPRAIPEKTKVFVITADAKKFRVCQETRRVIQDAFKIPDLVWAHYLDNANGYFGCEATDDLGTFDGFNTWAFFEAKQLRNTKGPDGKYYHWTKIGIFSRWIPSTEQTGILLLSSKEHDSSIPFTPIQRELKDPFWLYPSILDKISNLQEKAIWGIRDAVRRIETKRDLTGESPKPHYENLHEIARHAIHVTESVDVTLCNLKEMTSQHQTYTTHWHNRQQGGSPRDSSQDIAFWKDLNVHRGISRRLEFFQSHIESIGHRAKANEKRLQNEIQLAYNLISARDTAETVKIGAATVKIGEAARADSATMKTLAFVTLIFLPPTFISTIFGMQFFAYDADNGFDLASEFWIYWAITIPTTAITCLVWGYWSKLFPQHPGNIRNLGHRRVRSIHDTDDIEHGVAKETR